MDNKEINELINIRQYMVSAINNPAIDRQMVSTLQGMLILIDKKICNILIGDDFKEYIGFADVKKAISEVAQINNIKSGLKNFKVF